jgi:plasmid stabilization system protein ParE
VKVLYRQTASDDIVRQFRYYLLTAEAPEIALRFREAVRRTIQSLGQNPHVGPRYSSSNPRVQNLRSWPVAGFEAIRILYIPVCIAKVFFSVEDWRVIPLFAQSVPDRCHATRSRPASRLPGTYPHDAQLDYFRIAERVGVARRY